MTRSQYRYAPHNDVSVNDGPHIRRWSHKIIIMCYKILIKGTAVPLQAWTGPEGCRKLRFPDYVTMAQDGGKVVSL